MNYSRAVMQAVCDGDLDTKMKDVPYSTSVRELIFINEMIAWGEREEAKCSL